MLKFDTITLFLLDHDKTLILEILDGIFLQTSDDTSKISNEIFGSHTFETKVTFCNHQNCPSGKLIYYILSLFLEISRRNSFFTFSPFDAAAERCPIKPPLSPRTSTSPVRHFHND